MMIMMMLVVLMIVVVMVMGYDGLFFFKCIIFYLFPVK